MARHGASRHGVVLLAAVAKLGVPSHAIRQMRRRGLLVQVGRGVDRLRDHPWTHDARCQAALDLAGPGAALGGHTAARRHGFYRYRDDESIEVLVTRGTDHRTAVGRVWQTNRLPPSHVTIVDGFPVTTPARAFFDLCARPPHRMSVNHPAHELFMRAVYDDCVARRGVTFVLETAVLLVLAERGRAGTCLVRRLLLTCDADYVPTESDTERLFVDFLEAFGLPPPERQVDISGPDGWIGRVDFCWPQGRFVVEVDSTAHDSAMEKRADAARDAALRVAGHEVRRVRYQEIISRPAALARELGAAIVSRGR
ncbi:MAG: type IV toxin-antitoxin system AbiEi family antitoxin domain-containing protein [Acidimicrobiia bacterium]|nr:type IV toxin-antitoxin system AbiEi family antitoxin domain-containing protein [Acidimicrobiia bacterium]